MCVEASQLGLTTRYPCASHTLTIRCSHAVCTLLARHVHLRCRQIRAARLCEESLQPCKKIVRIVASVNCPRNTIHVLLVEEKGQHETSTSQSLTSCGVPIYTVRGEIAMQSPWQVRGVSRQKPRFSLRTHVRSTHDLSFPVNG